MSVFLGVRFLNHCDAKGIEFLYFKAKLPINAIKPEPTNSDCGRTIFVSDTV